MRRIPLTRIQFLEEVIALVVNDDEGREILDLDAPDRFRRSRGSETTICEYQGLRRLVTGTS
jgi:hypothetical protein